jgi:hypothetical protein
MMSWTVETFRSDDNGEEAPRNESYAALKDGSLKRVVETRLE